MSWTPGLAQFDLTRLLQQALGFHRQGQLEQAEALYRRILAEAPRHFDAQHLLGVIAFQRRDLETAIRLIGQALQIEPNNAVAHANHAAALRDFGHSDAALSSFDRALALEPNLPEALANRSALLYALGRPRPALAGYDRLIALRPDQAAAHYGRAIVLQALERWEAALGAFDRALALQPNLVEALANRGAVLRALGRPEAALDSYDRVLALRPDFPEVLNNRGSVLLDLRRPAEAVASYDRALALQPGQAEILNNRGNALLDAGSAEAAVASYGEALRLRPHYPEALNNRASVLRSLARYEAAAEDYRRLQEIAPDFAYTAGDLLAARRALCDWNGDEAALAGLEPAIGAGRRAIHPFNCLAISDSPGDQRRCAEIYAADKTPRQSPIRKRSARYGHDRIRLAYLSADFHDHATAHLMAELFETHDRTRFETVALSFGPDRTSPMRTRLEAGFSRFIDIRDTSDRAAAQLLKDMEIDIAVDLKGYTGGSRPGILAFRPAPVQVNYLGFPGTMGADHIDYILADRFIIPAEQERFYSENVVCLPECYQPNDSKRIIAEVTPTRAQAGLPETGFVFCSFNSNYKITPQIFDLWMRLLRQVEGSVLWLLGGSAAAIRNLRREAGARGVDPERLVFAPRLPPPEHLARHRLADLFLDTLPCNAHTTASDALWAGLPVLTCPGAGFAARVAGSLVQAAGLPELIAPDLDAYAALALGLARDPDRLAAIKAKLAGNRTTVPLFDIGLLRRHIERAYETMWACYERGEAPAGFTVAPEPH
jgi:protein O-GlcNAc transferase